MQIAIVGPGRLGRSLATLLPGAGHRVTLHDRRLDLPAQIDLIWLTVPDRSLSDVARALPEGPPVVHASGVSDLTVLKPHPRRASLHPLMTFPGPEIALPSLDGVPAAVDASDPSLLTTVEALARSLGLTPVRVPGDRRLYHAAAVMAGNLATVLLAEAGRALEAAGVPAQDARAMLAPLAQASLRNAVGRPAAALTGPVARGDTSTLDGHRDALRQAGLTDLLPLYDDGMSRAARIRDSQPPPNEFARPPT